jgi:hypothetical protein
MGCFVYLLNGFQEIFHINFFEETPFDERVPPSDAKNQSRGASEKMDIKRYYTKAWTME